jgi:hypothetical protein
MRGKRQRLAAAIDAAIERWCMEPFAWGSSDCLLALSDIIQEARGYDPAADWRGRYKSALGAARVTRRFGGFAGALESAAIGCVWEKIDPRDAAIGDIGIAANSRGLRCGLIRHHKLWIGRGVAGFTGVPTDMVEKAWRVN